MYMYITLFDRPFVCIIILFIANKLFQKKFWTCARLLTLEFCRLIWLIFQPESSSKIHQQTKKSKTLWSYSPKSSFSSHFIARDAYELIAFSKKQLCKIAVGIYFMLLFRSIITQILKFLNSSCASLSLSNKSVWVT